MELICCLLLPHVVIGGLLGVGEYWITKKIPRISWILPVIALVAWIAMLAIGSQNDPGGQAIIFVFFGCPALLFWSMGLSMGWK